MYKKLSLLYFVISFIFLSSVFSKDYSSESYSIVFYYSGNTPSYIKDSLFQARLFNKKAPIFFIGNKNCLLKGLPQAIKDLNINFIKIEDLEKSNNHILFNKKYINEKYEKGKSRVGSHLWFKKYSDRFFYIEELANKYNLKNIFQIECDVMIYTDLSKLFPVFQKSCTEIAAPIRLDIKSTSVSFVYFKDKIAINDLTSFFVDYDSKPLIDMAVLYDFAKQRKNSFYILPTVFKECLDILSMPKNTLSMPKTALSILYSNIKELNSIFDHDFSGTLLNVHKGVISCIKDNIKFSWKIDEENRLIPYANAKGKSYKMNTLHIWPKKLSPYLSINDLRPEDNRIYNVERVSEE